MNTFRYLEGVSTLAVDAGVCVGCGMCTAVCPHGVLALRDGKVAVVDRNGCMECGACAINCPAAAITVTPGVGCAAYIIQTWIKGKSTGSGPTVRCC
jgi:ferredoxin